MKQEEIAGLLSQGIPPSELVRRGYARGTVYKVARGLPKRGPPQPLVDGICSKNPQSVDLSIESDPDVVALKKEVRMAELEGLLKEIRAPIDLEGRLEGLEQTIKKLEDSVEYHLGMLIEDIEASPLIGLKEKFKCTCGEEGLVATKVFCTACTRETSYGWWPKEAS